MKLDKGTLASIASAYLVGSVITALYVQPWTPFWRDDQLTAWEYVIFWPYAIYKQGSK